MSSTGTAHVDPKWAEAFLLELRLQGVPGRLIGTALAEVEAHCAESGESAVEAFGDPVSYATALGLPADSDSGAPTWLVVVDALFGVGGMLLVLEAIGSRASQKPISVTPGILIVVVALLAAMVLLVRHSEPVLRALVRHWWIGAMAGAVLFALIAPTLVLADASLFTVPWVPTLVAGVLLLVANTALTLRHAPSLDDPVLGPEGPSGVGSLAVGRGTAIAMKLSQWLFPVATVVLAALLLLLL
jgi:hypothetical protein